MKNIELECMPDWRFCTIPKGEKGPRSAGWQRQYNTLDQIPQDTNVGVLLGPPSGGIVALDFDGTSAWTWFREKFDVDLTTIMWTSGKQDRCQMAFTVPEMFWDDLRTQKIATGDGEGFEFRWTGCQSVLPPSTLNDGRTYEWIFNPSNNDIGELHNDVLCYWLDISNPVYNAEPVDASVVHKHSEDEIVQIYEEFKRQYPQLDYDRWARATWIICRELGQADGLTVMKYFYPESKPGDYNILFKSKHTGPICSLGTIVEWIRERNPEYKRRLNQQDRVNSLATKLSKLELELKKKYNI